MTIANLSTSLALH